MFFTALKFRFAAILLMSLAGSTAWADWQLLAAESSLHFISVKNSHVMEVHSFTKLQGKVQNDGSAEVRVNLASVDTAIAVRDERMREMFFETDVHPVAVIRTQMHKGWLEKLEHGDVFTDTVDMTLQLHGVSKVLPVTLRLSGTARGRLLAVSQSPVLLSVELFDLLPGLQKLQAVAKLTSISKTVPVTFSLLFAPSSDDTLQP